MLGQKKRANREKKAALFPMDEIPCGRLWMQVINDCFVMGRGLVRCHDRYEQKRKDTEPIVLDQVGVLLER